MPGNVTNVVALAAGTLHSLALRSNGTVAGWGDNLFGQANVSDLGQVKAIAAGSTYSLALLSNGTVVVRGTQPAPPAGLTNVTAIAAGWSHCLALKQDGTVVSWGDTNSVPAGLRNVVAIAAGDGHSLALLGNGRVVAWGNNSFGKATVPPAVTSVVAISAGKDHCLTLRQNGTVVAWGRNEDGQATVPAGLTNIVAITAGAFHSVALRGNGTLAAWGNNTFGQSGVPGWTGFFQVAAGGYHNLSRIGDGSPAVLVQPASQNVPTGGDITFHVTAVGAPPLNYQWRRDGTNLVSITNTTLAVSNVQLSDAGAYSVEVGNNLGSVVSRDAILTPFESAPSVIVQPPEKSAFCGDVVVFEANVSGSGPLSYQWRFEEIEIIGATNVTLVLAGVTTNQAGGYSVSVTNAFGGVTSAEATLTVAEQTPVIGGPLAVAGTQGEPFVHSIAVPQGAAYSAIGLPLGLALDPLSGVISGTPLEPGTYPVMISVANPCGQDADTLVLTIASAVPVITGGGTVNGTEGTPINPYQITATGLPESFSAQNLPSGLSLDQNTGLISGTPLLAGTFSATISASNVWGASSATLQFNIANAFINGLQLSDVTYNYRSPYLLEFEFTLRDSDGNGIVTHPSLLSVVGMENTHPGTLSVIWPDDEPNLPTATNLVTNVIAETGVFLARASGGSGGQVIKSYLVLDFTESISDPVLNGDSNEDGISDAVDSMLNGAQHFVNQQTAGSQVGVYEFHRDDEDPNEVSGLTSDKEVLNEAIAGIWTNYVNWFYSGSRCWDAVNAAILALGAANPDEQHYVIFLSDGQDSSSAATVEELIANAQTGRVRVYCIAYGSNPDLATLTRITDETGGRLFDAQNQEELFEGFAQIARDVPAQYVLRWASLRRDTNEIAPFFLISYQGFTTGPAAWTWGNNNDYVTNTTEIYITNLVEDIDNTMDPPVTNLVEEIETNTVDEITALWTNVDIGSYVATNYAGTVTEGSLRLALDEAVEPSGINLRATYIPRFVRQLRFHYRANWPVTASLNATNVGEMLFGWSLTQSNDVDGSTWLLLSSPNPTSTTTSLPFPGFGPLLTFRFHDVLSNPAEAFAFINVDNSIYTGIPAGGQSFVFEEGSATNFVTDYPALPLGTPVPWLIANGITNNFEAAELADPDGDGIPTWQEYRANTNPQDPASNFVVRGLSNDIYGRYQVSFSTALNRRYRVETSFDLINWEIVEADVSGTGADVTILDRRYHPWITQVFYRAIVY